MRLFIKHAIIAITIMVAAITLTSCATSSYKLKQIDLDSDVVLIYTTSWCRYCKDAKVFLDRNYIPYIEIDYDNRDEFKRLTKIATEMDYRGVFDRVPVFIVRKNILVGYDPETILMILSDGKYKL